MTDRQLVIAIFVALLVHIVRMECALAGLFRRLDKVGMSSFLVLQRMRRREGDFVESGDVLDEESGTVGEEHVGF